MRRSYRCAALLILTVVLTAPSLALAFKTFRLVGGNVHEQIIREALTGLVSEENITIIDRECTKNDDVTSSRFTDAHRHFDSNLVDESLRSFVRPQMDRAVRMAERADTDPKQRELSLQAIGNLLHAIHDFYAHSNYVELMLKAGTPPAEIPAINWDRPPKRLKTGYFYWNHAADNEATESRDVCIAGVRKVFPRARFATEREKADLRGAPESYSGAIKFATSDYDLLHLEINKDNAEQEQGKIVHPGSGLTLHEIARRVAVKETHRQWKTYLDRLRAAYPDRASAVVSAVSGMHIVVEPKPAGQWSCEIQEHPLAGGGDRWGVRWETVGNRRIIHLVQNPGQNPFDKEHPEIAKQEGGMGRGATIRHESARRNTERDCDRFRKTGR